MQKHRHQEFIRFLNAVEREVPAGKLIHVVLDNYGAHKHPKVIAWLERHPRWIFHFTPTSGSWRRLSFRRRSPGRHQALHRAAQRRSQALHMDYISENNRRKTESYECVNALGRGDNSSDHDGDSGDFDEAHEVGEQFVVARCDPPELLELVEKSFDDVALFIEHLVVGVLMLAVTPWRDHRLGTDIQDGVHQAVGVIGSIRQHRLRFDAVDEIEPFDHVVFMAGPCQQAARIAQSIGGRGKLGREATPRATQALGFLAPFFFGAPAAC
jgi:hypothetical protein